MFPHHENEIAHGVCQWQDLRTTLDARPLPAREGKKMSKSEGNFYTLRDLLLKGYRASAIRFLLSLCHTENRWNFTSTACDALQLSKSSALLPAESSTSLTVRSRVMPGLIVFLKRTRIRGALEDDLTLHVR